MTASATVLKSTALKPTTPIEVDELLYHVDKVRVLNDLAAWIGRARDRIDSVDFNAKHDEALAGRLKNCDFGTNNVDWNVDIADGVEALHDAIAAHLIDIRDSLEASR